MGAPSLKTLRKFYPEEQARRIRALMTGQLDPREYTRVENWVEQCFNEPSDEELIMAALDEELGGFGVEAIRGRYVDRFWRDNQASYVNTGDTYDLTVVHDHETGNYALTSIGDWVEAHERKRQIA